MTEDVKDIDHTVRNVYEEPLINVDLKLVKRQGELFSVASRPDIEKMKKKRSLCSRCGLMETCEIKKKTDKLSDEVSAQGITTIPILVCKQYQVPLYIKDKTGTNLVEWNTFKYGTAWVNRVRQGEIVALTDQKGRKFGEAEVARVHCLSREAAIARFSYTNHMFVERKMAPEKAAAAMRRIIMDAYGHAVAYADAKLTVIELVRVN